MTKATFKITGDIIQQELINAIDEFQQDDYVVKYAFENGHVFMFEQYQRSLNNYVLNVILDFSMNSDKNEFVIQCFAMGAKNRTKFSLINYEKSTIEDLRAHVFAFSQKNSFGWDIGALEYI